MVYKLNGKALAVGVAFTDSNGTNYPANWLNFSTAEDRAAVPTGGIKWEDDPPYYDKRFYWNQSTAKDIDDLEKEYFKTTQELERLKTIPEGPEKNIQKDQMEATLTKHQHDIGKNL